MLDTVRRYLEGVASQKDRYALQRILEALADRYSSCSLSQNTIAITSGGATTAKIATSDWYGVANGMLVKIASGTNLPALTGINISAGFFNVVCFFCDSGGTVTAAGGTQGSVLGNVVFPQLPKSKALVGFLLITYASAFTGGSTPLDTATTVYFAPDGAFDPTVLTG